jgi:trehalose/maltose hydrolase-like predicted phosphorylase/CheY-like chemotaxis protein
VRHPAIDFIMLGHIWRVCTIKQAQRCLGRIIYNEDLVNCPNWLLIQFKIDGGKWVVPTESTILDYNQELDMRRGILTRSITCEHDGKITTIFSVRLVHIKDPHTMAITYTIKPENYGGTITIRSALDGTIQNTGVARYRQLNTKHWTAGTVRSTKTGGIILTLKSKPGNIKIATASKARLFIGNSPVKIVPKLYTRKNSFIAHDFTVSVEKKQSVTIEKNVTVYSSLNYDVKNPVCEVKRKIKKVKRFEDLLRTHVEQWADLWGQFDMEIKGDDFTQLVLRLHAFHLLQSFSHHNVWIDAGITARGLHGEAYRGHIFWDELFVMPFYDFHNPDISKSLLMYRFRRLKEARKYAVANDYNGSMFPWQSGSSGVEETQVVHLNPISGKWGPDYSCIQRHVSFAIAYNVWQYWLRSHDRVFMKKNGVELLLSIAQFGASLAKYSAKDDKYHTERIMGPDEFHEKYPGETEPGLRDNAYTNLLIVWTLMKAHESLHILSEKEKKRILKKIGLTLTEIRRWKDITRKMHVIMNEDGIVSQFEGYFGLKELNWDAYRKKYGNIHRMDRILKAEGKSPNEYKVAKQADVLQLFYLLPLEEIQALFSRLGYSFDARMLKRNYDYYVQRTSHGSTLSKVVHCYVAHILGRKSEAWEWYKEVINSDINDTQGGTTPEGIHAGVMASSLSIAMRGFAGIEFYEDRITIDPKLPHAWKSFKMNFVFRKTRIFLAIFKQSIRIMVEGTKGKKYKYPIVVDGVSHMLKCGTQKTVSLKKTKSKRKVSIGSIGQARQERVLIVDGDIVGSEQLETRLEELGYKTELVTKGKDALDILKIEWIDLIILSVNLQGGMNGFQLLQEIRSHKNFAAVPIIVLTNKHGLKDCVSQYNIQGFVKKPYSVSTVMTKAKRIISK